MNHHEEKEKTNHIVELIVAAIINSYYARILAIYAVVSVVMWH